MTREELREVIVRADSYLSLLWHRHTKAEARADTDLAYEVSRVIGDLRSASKALASQDASAEQEEG